MEYNFGYIEDPEDTRDILLGNYLIPQKLPPVIDWDDWSLPVKDQGKTSSCVGQSSTAMKEIQEKLEHNKAIQFDGFSLYDACKKIDGIPNQQGTYIRIAMKILQETGIGGYKIKSYSRLNNLQEIKTALVSTGPIVVGFPVYDSFYKPVKGVINLPKEGENINGGHAVLLTGYDDNQKFFKMKNSWGQDWGMKGYAFLTYSFVDSFKKDAWSSVDADDKVAATFIDVQRLSEDVDKVKNGEK